MNIETKDNYLGKLILANAINLLIRGYQELHGDIDEALAVLIEVHDDYKTELQKEGDL